MISYIQSLPVGLGFLAVVGVGVLFSTLGTLIVNAVFTPEELIENNVVGGFKFAFLAQIVAALLAFSLVDSASRFVSFQFRCDREIATVSLMQKLEPFLPQQAARLHEAQDDYLRKVVDIEWETMRKGDASPEVTAALESWYTLAMSIRPANDQERLALSQYVRLFSQIVENRTGRISDSTSPFENLVWMSIGIAIVITISFNWFFGSYSLITQVAMGGLLSAGVMMIVYLAIILASPISSPIGTVPTDYAALIR